MRTAPTGFQFRVPPVQRRGVLFLAAMASRQNGDVAAVAGGHVADAAMGVLVVVPGHESVDPAPGRLAAVEGLARVPGPVLQRSGESRGERVVVTHGGAAERGETPRRWSARASSLNAAPLSAWRTSGVCSARSHAASTIADAVSLQLPFVHLGRHDLPAVPVRTAGPDSASDTAGWRAGSTWRSPALAALRPRGSRSSGPRTFERLTRRAAAIALSYVRLWPQSSDWHTVVFDASSLAARLESGMYAPYGLPRFYGYDAEVGAIRIHFLGSFLGKKGDPHGSVHLIRAWIRCEPAV